MRAKFTVVLLLFVCLSVFGAQTTPVTVNQQESVSQLQAENEAMKKQLENLEKEVELYRGDVRTKIAEIDNEQSRRLTFLAILMGLIGVVLGIGAPYFINKDNRKRLEERFSEMKEDLKDIVKVATEQAGAATTQANYAKDAFNQMQPQIKSVSEQLASATEQVREASKQAIKAETASDYMQSQMKNITEQVSSATVQASVATEQTKQAKQAVEEIEKLKKQVSKIQEKINQDTIAAENAAKEAKASQLFAEALNEKDSLKAIDLYNQAIDIKSDFFQAFNNRGILKDKMGDQTGAMSDYNEAISLNPNDANAYINRGLLKYKMNDYTGAMSDYDKAISLNPNDADAYNNRGNLRKNMKDQAGALQDYNKVIELDPNDGDAYYNRANLRKEMKEQAGALQDYNKAIELDPNDSASYNNRADFYLQINDLDKALKDANKSIELGGEFISFVTRGEIFMAMNNYIDAINDFTQALSYNPNSIETLEYRAKCYRKLAEAEQDPAKKADLIAKAEADEKVVKSLKKKKKNPGKEKNDEGNGK